MSKRIFLLLSALCLALVSAGAATSALAQKELNPARTVPRYNRATEVVMKGTVVEVMERSGPAGLIGTHLTLRVSTGTVSVHLAPSAFLLKNDFELAPGEQIEVLGSTVKHGMLLARVVKKGDKVLILRNAMGIPQWPRSRRGRPTP